MTVQAKGSLRAAWLAALLSTLSVGSPIFAAAAERMAGSAEGWITLFDGTSLDGWRMAGPGNFTLETDGSMLSRGGMGLFYYEKRMFRDFVLELEWKVDNRNTANSGIFLRFPAKTNDPWYAVNNGYEIQIDDTDDPSRYTGSVYGFQAPVKLASRPVGEWNQYRIQVTGQRYEVWLNGEKVNDFFGNRGREGYIGVQNHDAGSRVWFRNIRVQPLAPNRAAAPESLAELFKVERTAKPIRVLMFTATYGFRHASISTAKEVMRELDATTEFDFDITEDIRQLNRQNLRQYDVLFFANTTGNFPLTDQQRQAIKDFLRAGRGFAGAHAAADAGYDWPDYREMLGGGLFKEHPWTQGVDLVVEEPEHPAVAHFPGRHTNQAGLFSIRDEIYVFDKNPRWNSHVLLSLDMRSVGIPQGPATAEGNDHPISWCRHFNGGRVFYTALGHMPEVWRNPGFLEHLLQGLRIAAGRLEADCTGHLVKETIATNVWPDDIAVDERGNVWIAELRGKVHRFDAQTGRTAQIGLIPTTDPTNIEHGLYGIEVDPNFYKGEPYVYLYYAEPGTFINTLARFIYRDGRLDMGTKRVLLRVPTEPQCCHQAGDLEWGPDGKLYLSTGDNGMSSTRPEWEISKDAIEAFMRRYNLTTYHWSRLADSERSAQNLQDLRGKILRLNKDGTIPKDNPFYGRPGVRWEIFAYGLRNPYRISADPLTGCIYIGTVGADAEWDQDNFWAACKGGENFGWPRASGSFFFNEWTAQKIPSYTPPLWGYTYATGGRAAMAGPVYRYQGEGAFPPIFQGRLFVYDWSRRWIKWAEVQDGRLVNIKTFDTLRGTQPISMQLGPDGSLYVAEFTGFWGPAPGSKVTRYRWERGDVISPDPGALAGSDEPIPAAPAGEVNDSPPLSDAIVGAWLFDEGAGENVKDASRFGHHGRFQNPEWTQGKFGTAGKFTPGKSYVEVAGSETLSPASQFTITAWVYLNGFIGEDEVCQSWPQAGCKLFNSRILQSGTYDPNSTYGIQDNHYRLLLEWGNLVFDAGPTVNPRSVQVPLRQVLAAERWIHVAGVYTGEAIKLYIDGKLVTAAPAGGDPLVHPESYRLFIGAKSPQAPAGDGWNGALDEVAIFKRALTQAEIQSVMAGLRPIIGK